MPELSTELTVFVALVSGCLLKYIFGLMTRDKKSNMVQIGTVTQINCYPVKSCRGFTVESGLCTPLGLKISNCVDRHWVVTRANGDFVTQRQFPKMALIGTEVKGDTLELTAPGVTSLVLPLSIPVTKENTAECRVWHNHLLAVDCGQKAGQWLSTYLQEPGLRLLWSAPSMPKVDMTLAVNPWGNPARPGDQCAFTDNCSYLLASESSLEELNSRLQQPVTMKWFRPSIVIKGCPAFDEDSWAELIVGEKVNFRMLDPCTRCLVTTVHQEKGEKDPNSEPLNTLRSFRCFPEYGKSPLFGVNAAADVQGVIKVGDPVYAMRK